MRTLARLRVVAGRGLTLGTLMDQLAAVHGDRRLVDQGGPRPLTLTYRQAAEQVARWAAGIAPHVAPGDRVVVGVPNSYEQFLLCLAASRAGAVVVPVNPGMRDDEVEHVVADSGAVLVLRDLDDLPEGEPGAAVALDPGDVAAIFYTSGTTGRPKGARLTHEALLGQAVRAALWPGRLRRDEAVISLPVAHIMGFVVLAVLACAGVPTWFLPHFRPTDVLDAVEGRRATLFIGVPAMYRMLLEAGAEERDLSSVRLWATGADVMPDDLARRFKAMGASVTLPVLGVHLGQAAFASGYGQVESAGGVAVKISPPMLPVGLGDGLGLPIPPYRLRVVDEDGHEVRRGEVGELVVKGPGVLRGYHGDEEATRRALTGDGWLRTGDLARRGALGVVHFAGRSKDVIKHGGYSVFAAEVEQVLEQHPAVAEAAVAGLPDERMGEVPVAAVRLSPGPGARRPGAGSIEDELRAWAAERLAEYKVPRQVRVVDDLPRTGTQKVRKREVLAHFG